MSLIGKRCQLNYITSDNETFFTASEIIEFHKAITRGIIFET